MEALWIITGSTLLAVLYLLWRLREAHERIIELEKRLAEIRNKLVEAAREAVTAENARLEGQLAGRLETLSEAVEEVRHGLTDLSDRETSVAPAPRVAEQVEPLLREVVDVLESRFKALESRLGEPRSESLSTAVSRMLGEDGFAQVTVLEGPLPDGDRFRVLVEARKEGMTYKGPVFLLGTEVVEHRLAPSYPMFP